VALWLAITRHPADQAQQQQVVAGFLLGRRARSRRAADSRALLKAITATPSEHLPPRAAD
jgi:monoamine oxidase